MQESLYPAYPAVFMRRHKISREIRQTLFIDKCPHNTALHTRRLIQHILHFFRLHTLAENHHLPVLAMKKGYVAIRKTIAEITAAIHPPSIRKKDEIRLLRRIADITTGNTFSKNADFTSLTIANLI